MTETFFTYSPGPKKLALAIVLSLLLNVALWAAIATQAGKVAPIPEDQYIQIERVTIEKEKITPKIVKPQEIKKKVEEIKKPAPTPQHKIKQKAPPPPPPPTAHNKVK